MSDAPRITYSTRPDATPEAELSALVAVYAYVIKMHNSKKIAECAASDDHGGPTKIRTQGKEASVT